MAWGNNSYYRKRLYFKGWAISEVFLLVSRFSLLCHGAMQMTKMIRNSLCIVYHDFFLNS